MIAFASAFTHSTGSTGGHSWGDVAALILVLAGAYLLAKALRLVMLKKRDIRVTRLSRLLAYLLIGSAVWAPARAASPSLGESRIATVLGLQYGVPKQAIASQRAKGRAWGEIAQALVVSQKSGKTFRAVLWLRDSGLGWSEICAKLGLDPAEVAAKAREVERAVGEGPEAAPAAPLTPTSK